MNTNGISLDFAKIAAIYFISLCTAIAVFALLPQEELIKRLLLADIAATIVVFFFSVLTKNASVYDPYWSIAPVALLAGYLWCSVEGVSFIRQLLVIVVTLAWGLRLTGNWAYSWRGLSHEDWRYIELRGQSGPWYFVVNLTGIHLVPTLIVFLGCLAMYPAVSAGTQPLNLWDVAAVIITAAALWLETKADWELHKFRAQRQDSAEVLNTGVWAWCRHPNYLGEIGFWIGIFLFGYAASGNTAHHIAMGPLAMILLFVFISIPMIDKRLVANKPGYADYKATTLALIPLGRLKK